MLDIVIPVCARDAAQAQLLLRSIETYVDRDTIGRVVLVSVDEPGFHLQMRQLTTPGLRTRLEHVTPADLGVSVEVQRRHRGWLVQQAVKLMFARHAQGEFFLVLDSKNLALRPVNLDALLRDGRAPWVLEDVGHHPRWWQGSARLLRHKMFDRCSPRRALSSATPVMLHTRTVRELLAWVEHAYAEPFERAFLRRPILPWLGRATEFYTYFTYLDREGQLEAHHFEAPWFHDVSLQVWSSQPESVQLQRVLRMLEAEPFGIFSGIQAAVWHSLDDGLRVRLAARASGELSTSPFVGASLPQAV